MRMEGVGPYLAPPLATPMETTYHVCLSLAAVVPQPRSPLGHRSIAVSCVSDLSTRDTESRTQDTLIRE